MRVVAPNYPMGPSWEDSLMQHYWSPQGVRPLTETIDADLC